MYHRPRKAPDLIRESFQLSPFLHQTIDNTDRISEKEDIFQFEKQVNYFRTNKQSPVLSSIGMTNTNREGVVNKLNLPNIKKDTKRKKLRISKKRKSTIGNKSIDAVHDQQISKLQSTYQSSDHHTYGLSLRY